MIHEPKNLTLAQKRDIIERQKYKNKGGKITCGHDFWTHAKDKPSGDIFLCTRCSQYFVKMNGLPWWVDGGQNMFGRVQEPHSAHHVEAGGWYSPIEIRLQDVNGNSISN